MDSEVKFKISFFHFEIIIFSFLYFIFSIWIYNVKVTPEQINKKNLERLVRLAENIKFNYKTKSSKELSSNFSEINNRKGEDVLVKKENKLYTDRHEPPPVKEEPDSEEQKTGYNGDIKRFGTSDRNGAYSSSFDVKQKLNSGEPGTINRKYSLNNVIGRRSISDHSISKYKSRDVLKNDDVNNKMSPSNFKKPITDNKVESDNKYYDFPPLNYNINREKKSSILLNDFTELTSFLNLSQNKITGIQISINSMKKLYDRIDNIKKTIRSNNFSINSDNITANKNGAYITINSLYIIFDFRYYPPKIFIKSKNIKNADQIYNEIQKACKLLEEYI